MGDGRGGEGGGNLPGRTCLWSEGFGDVGWQQSSSVAVDGAGNVYLTGAFEGTLDFGSDPLSSQQGDVIFVAKRDASGGHLWSKQFGAPYSRGTAVAADAEGNVYVTGLTGGSADFGGGPIASTGFITKLDPSGSHVWSKGFEGEPLAVTIDAFGDVLLTGHFWGTIDFGGDPLVVAGPNDDLFVAKLDGAGEHLWSKRFGDGEFQSAYALATDSSGDVVVVAGTIGSIDFGGGPLSGSNVRLAVAKLDPSGGHLWSKQFGYGSMTVGFDVAIGQDDTIVIVGEFAGAVDFGGGPLNSTAVQGYPTEDAFVAKLDAGGEHLWSKRFGDEGEQAAAGVAIDPAGRVALTGWFEHTVDFGGGPFQSASFAEDAFVAVLDGAGNHLASRPFGNVYADYAAGIAVNEAGQIILTGFYENDVDFGCGLLPTGAERDVFLAALTVP